MAPSSSSSRPLVSVVPMWRPFISSFSFSLIILFFFPILGCHSFFVHVNHHMGGGSWATGMSYRHDDGVVAVTGTVYDPPLDNDNVGSTSSGGGEVTVAGTGDTDCFVSIIDGDPQALQAALLEQSNRILETPQMCMISPVWLQQGKDNNDDSIPVVLFGLNDQDSVLDSVRLKDDSDNDNDNNENDSNNVPFPLMQNTIPVASIGVQSASDKSDVLVALQDLEDNSFATATAAGTPQKDKNMLQLLLDFFEETAMTQDEPNDNESSSSTAPALPVQVVRINAVTGTPQFHTEVDTDEGTIATVTAMDTVGDKYLALAGNTNGSGQSVGNPVNDDMDPFGNDNNSTTAGTDNNVNDWDGYVTYLDLGTGAMVDANIAPIVRVHSQAGKDDFVRDICVLEEDSSSDDNGDGTRTYYIILVGTTKGLMESIHAGGAFVWKVEVATGDVIWERQIAGPTVEGLSCAVSSKEDDDDDDDDDLIFVGGTTHIDLNTNAKPSPSKDVWVRALSATTGATVWSQQVDSSDVTTARTKTTTTNNLYSKQQQMELRDDVLVGLQVGNAGGIYALWNSMDLEQGINDVYLMDFDKNTGENDLSLGIAVVDPEDSSSSSSSGQWFENENDSSVIAIAITIPVLIALMVFALQWYRNSTGIENIPKSFEEHVVDIDGSTEVV